MAIPLEYQGYGTRLVLSSGGPVKFEPGDILYKGGVPVGISMGGIAHNGPPPGPCSWGWASGSITLSDIGATARMNELATKKSKEPTPEEKLQKVLDKIEHGKEWVNPFTGEKDG